MDLAHARLIVSGDALLSVAQAARLVGGRQARAWIEAHVTIRWVAGQRRVLWRDVIAASDAADSASDPTRSRQVRTGGSRLRLANLD